MGFYVNPPADGFQSMLNTGLYVDKTGLIAYTNSVLETVRDIQYYVIEELRETYPNCIGERTRSLPIALSQISSKTGTKFYIIIDEWDALFREAKKI